MRSMVVFRFMFVARISTTASAGCRRATRTTGWSSPTLATSRSGTIALGRWIQASRPAGAASFSASHSPTSPPSGSGHRRANATGTDCHSSSGGGSAVPSPVTFFAVTVKYADVAPARENAKVAGLNSNAPPPSGRTTTFAAHGSVNR